MKTNKIIIAMLCAAMCVSAASCNGNDKKTSGNKSTSVTVQGDDSSSNAEESKSDYVEVSVEGMEVIKTGWINLPTGKEYINLLNAPDEKYLNGYAYANFPCEVYKEEGEWLLVKTKGKVGYIPAVNFTETAPEKEGEVISDTSVD